jgi:hypothetical protein
VYNIHVKCSAKFVFEKKFEDTKGVIRRIIQHSDRTKKDEVQQVTQKTKD